MRLQANLQIYLQEGRRLEEDLEHLPGPLVVFLFRPPRLVTVRVLQRAPLLVVVVDVHVALQPLSPLCRLH